MEFVYVIVLFCEILHDQLFEPLMHAMKQTY